MITAKYGRIECMRLLLKRGVDVNKKEPSDHNRKGRVWVGADGDRLRM